MNYKITLSYDGSNFHGWAKQDNLRTVQNEIESCLKTLYQQNIIVTVAGRTDAKVHALAQICNFKTNKLIPPSNIVKVLRRYLPNDIYVKSIKKMPQSFHARYDAKGKIYKYFIANKRPSVFQNNYIYYHPQKLDMRLLKTTAKLFVGTHNFLSFTTSKLPNTTRTINDIKIAKDNQQTVITVKGNGFLRYMVRMLVGAMLDVSNHNKTTNDIRELLIHPKKGASITKAKACGLYLVKVCY